MGMRVPKKLVVRLNRDFFGICSEGRREKDLRRGYYRWWGWRGKFHMTGERLNIQTDRD